MLHRTAVRTLTALLILARSLLVTTATSAAPAQANARLYGLDCGIEGTWRSIGTPAYFSLDAAVASGPYVTPGTGSAMDCELRMDSPTGPTLASWGTAGVELAVLPYVSTVSVSGFARDWPTLYLCSTVEWRDGFGTHRSEGGCEWVNTWSLSSSIPGAEFEVTAIYKPQDHDLDDIPQPLP